MIQQTQFINYFFIQNEYCVACMIRITGHYIVGSKRYTFLRYDLFIIICGGIMYYTILEKESTMKRKNTSSKAIFI